MREVTYYCDRCGVELDRETAEWDEKVRMLAADSPLFGGVGHTEPDLCHDCLTELEDWWYDE